MVQKQVYAIRHVAFEDLGNLSNVLNARGFKIRYFEAGVDDLSTIISSQPEILVILGGPIGVYDRRDYPFLEVEIDILKYRLHHDLPTLGICLGAQLIADALGARVFHGGEKEIGWSKLILSPEGEKNFFSHLSGDKTHVLHWHGDTFDLPTGAILQTSSSMYQNQAFTFKRNTLALQFHPEVIENEMEKWFIGHACEIANTEGINVSELRNDTKRYAANLESSARAFWNEWLDGLNHDSPECSSTAYSQ